MTGATNSTVSLTWTAPDDNGGCPIDSYQVEYRAEGATKWKVASDEARPDFTVKKLMEDAVYEFRVAAHNRAGLGPYSQCSKPIQAQDPLGKDTNTSIYCK